MEKKMKKLSLNKEVIANLNNNAMNEVKGGWTIYTCYTECYTDCTCYCTDNTRCLQFTCRCVESIGCGAYTDDCPPSESVCC